MKSCLTDLLLAITIDLGLLASPKKMAREPHIPLVSQPPYITDFTKRAKMVKRLCPRAKWKFTTRESENRWREHGSTSLRVSMLEVSTAWRSHRDSSPWFFSGHLLHPSATFTSYFPWRILALGGTLGVIIIAITKMRKKNPPHFYRKLGYNWYNPYKLYVHLVHCNPAGSLGSPEPEVLCAPCRACSGFWPGPE